MLNNDIKHVNNNNRNSEKDNKYYYDMYELTFLETEKDNVKKLALTRKNVDFIETTLRIDSRYKNFSNENVIPSIEYVEYLKKLGTDSKKSEKNDKEKKKENLNKYGSSGYWIKQFIEIIKRNKKTNSSITETTIKADVLYREKKHETIQDTELNLETIIRGMVYAIDRENSTHLSAHKSRSNVGRYNVSERIYKYIKKYGIEKFIDNLMSENNFDLIGYLTVPKEPEKENYHYSFATKFCKYVSNAFCKEADKDNEKGKNDKKYKKDKYYVYDNVIISNIEYYIKTGEYKVEELKFNKNDYDKCKNKEEKKNAIEEQYKKFYNCLEKIRQEENKNIKKTNEEEISRDEFDHLIWYTNK